jgi:hypothetical protein
LVEIMKDVIFDYPPIGKEVRQREIIAGAAH